MYVALVILLALALPAACVAWGAASGQAVMPLVGAWFTFWAVGVRLTLAGIRQVAQPGFTARDIFHTTDPAALPIVREVGFGNLAIGGLGLLSLGLPGWTVPAAAAGGAFYALAAIGHALEGQRSGKETFAMVTDAWVAGVLGVFLVSA